MARTKRANAARDSRNWGKMSGVTYATLPSGTTISNNVIQTTDGYMGAYSESGLKVVTGIINTGSGKASNQTFTGITTIKHVTASPCVITSGSSAYIVCVDYNVAPNYTSGATVAHFKVYDYKGALASAAVSVAYTAIGV